ncbi:DUF6168 family protein [Croceivirga sp. JEA036]|uniref:DUF6168 family protein n=1 Tax=Croceivirga sp. JEA036 TaxID=2721162 RepID=UPI0014399E54|nr:DUF6168 family protein [Croceivirga sp. JEA036]NJB37105.1 hypothetical protein [Croceivirga sp. JEA036]
MKHSIKSLFVILGVGAVTYGIHTKFFLEEGSFLDFLSRTYFFHFICSALLVLGIQALSTVKSLVNSLGIAYLASLFIKMGLFVLLFKEPLFAEEETPKSELLSLLIPFFISLFVEVYFIAKILMKIDTSNNIQ